MNLQNDETILHDWVIRSIQKKYSRVYSEVITNTEQNKRHSYEGYYPDVLFVNFGQVTHVIEVETSSTITEERVAYWKDLASLSGQFVVLVPKEDMTKARELCWKNGLAANTKVGSYEVIINI